MKKIALFVAGALVAAAAWGWGRGMMGGGTMEAMPVVMAWMRGEELDGSPAGPPPADSGPLQERGRRVYLRHCTPCHGRDGDGRGPEAGRLGVPPTDFRAGVYKFRSTTATAVPTPGDLFRTISRGVHGTAMLPWAWLAEDERWGLVYYLRSLSPRFAAAAGEPVQIPPAPPMDAPLRERGRQLFGELRCAACHGAGGRGDGPLAAGLVDRVGRPARPRDLVEGRFRAGSSAVDLYRTLATGLAGTPMPAYDLGPEYLWPLVAYVRSLRAQERGRGPDPEERLGLRIDMGGMMGRGMMGRGMMGR